MKSPRLYLFLLAIMLTGLAGRARAQVYYVSMDTVLVVPSTLNLNDTAYIVTTLHAYNQLNQPTYYGGPLNFYVLTDSMMNAFIPPRIFQQDYQVSIDSSGSPVAIPLDLRPSEMRVGPNVIIVWPGYAIPAVNPVDSAMFNIYIDGFLGTDNPQEDKLLKYYPNPVIDQFVVQWMNSGDGEIIIMDTNGKQVMNRRLNNVNGAIPISLQGMKPGIYIVQIRIDQTVRRFKVIKQ